MSPKIQFTYSWSFLVIFCSVGLCNCYTTSGHISSTSPQLLSERQASELGKAGNSSHQSQAPNQQGKAAATKITAPIQSRPNIYTKSNKIADNTSNPTIRHLRHISLKPHPDREPTSGPLTQPAAKSNAEQSGKKYAIAELLELSWKNSPMLREAQQKLKSMQARRSEAVWSSWWPQGSIIGLVAPARGDAIQTSTPYPEAYGRLAQYGILTRVELSLIWPLYTFGKLSLLQNAASEGIKVSEADIERQKNQWTMMVKEAYYGLQFAESSLVLLEEAEEHLQEAKKQVKAKTDQLKLRVLEAEVQSRRIEAETGRQLAQSGLSRLTGLPLSPPLELEQPELEPIQFRPLDLEIYQKLAQKHRPEIRLLAHAIAAKRALLNVHRRLWTPDFFLAAFLRWGYSSAADDQYSPFARDDFNFFEAGGFLGMRFSFDLPITLAKIRQAEAEHQAFKHRRDLAVQGIAMQIEQRYRELIANQRLSKIYADGYKAANQWLSRVMVSYSSGLSEAKDLSEALLSYAKMRFAAIESLYKLHIAIAKLNQAIGIDILKIKDPQQTQKKIAVAQ
jgi:outer membrane protein TolC